MEDVTAKSWQEFLKLVATKSYSRPSQVDSFFRGQSDSSWDLKPSLLRYISDIKLKDAWELEDLLRKNFAYQIDLHAKNPDISVKEDILSWWAVMQHYGAPTRLLDWTLSPYVAAYFAVNSQFEKSGAIWLLDFWKLNESQPNAPNIFSMELAERSDFISGSDSESLLYVYERTKKNERMIAQQGVFTVSTDLMASHEKFLAKKPNPPGQRIIIPANLKKIFLQKLKIMNVNANALFPGLDGLGRSVAEIAILENAWIKGELN